MAASSTLRSLSVLSDFFNITREVITRRSRSNHDHLAQDGLNLAENVPIPRTEQDHGFGN